MESQDAIDVSAARLAVPSTSRAKGKERRNKEMDSYASKYFEVVQEKKGACKPNYVKYSLLMHHSAGSTRRDTQVPPRPRHV